MSKPERVLIVGGGFGGVKAAMELANKPTFAVTLLSDGSNLRYYPTLYLTAVGGNRANSSIALSSLFEKTNVKLVQAEAIQLDRQSKKVITKDNQSYNFDTLILSLGVVTNYFGIKGLKDYSYSIKSQSEATRFKHHLHKQLLEDNKADRAYVIVGAGPTGIELAGALPSYIKKIIKNHGLKQANVHLDLIEAMPRLLPNLPSAVSRKVRRRLRKLGVRLYLNSKVEGETANELIVNHKSIRSHSVIWTAGVTNHPFFSSNQFVVTAKGKVTVDTYLQTEPNIFVLGDNANTPYSGMAQTALYDGQFVARNLVRRSRNKDFKSYKAKKPITVIPAGPHWAIVIWGRLRFNGYFGYLIREVADIIGFHDLESWPKATRQYLSEYQLEEECPVCKLAMSKYTD